MCSLTITAEPFSKDGRAWFEQSLDKTYREFLSKVAMGRAPQVFFFFSFFFLVLVLVFITIECVLELRC